MKSSVIFCLLTCTLHFNILLALLWLDLILFWHSIVSLTSLILIILFNIWKIDPVIWIKWHFLSIILGISLVPWNSLSRLRTLNLVSSILILRRLILVIILILTKVVVDILSKLARFYFLLLAFTLIVLIVVIRLAIVIHLVIILTLKLSHLLCIFSILLKVSSILNILNTRLIIRPINFILVHAMT